jgi:hypothetical protein
MWWQSRHMRDTLPCLSQVATALLACNPSSGGLECDFGLLKDVSKPKRAALGQGFVKIEMMLKMNKHLFLSDPDKVMKLPNQKWQEYIPARQTYEALGDLDVDDNEILCQRNEENKESDMGRSNDLGRRKESNEERQRNNSDNDSLEEFGIDEYGDVILPMPPPVTDSQLSILTVYDEDETQKPGSLY